MNNILFLPAFLCASFVLPAQSATHEQAIRVFTRDFMAAYNRQDEAALQAMYTTDAVSIDPNGATTTGADSIAQTFNERFIRQDVTLLVRQMDLHWSDAQHAWVATGTYEMYGFTYVYDIPIRQKMAYSNTMIEENGHWKIARSVVTPLVKTAVYQKNVKLTEWEAALTGILQGSGIQQIELLPAEPNAGYALLEWPSLALAKVFFDNPAWWKNLQKTGKGGKPVVVFLDSK